jgi:hypothetical protein
MKRTLIIAALLIALLGAGAVTAAASTTRGTNRGTHHNTSRTTTVRGPRGPRGPRGARGPAGPAGAQGPQGVAGASQLANATIVTASDTLGPMTVATFSAACPSGTRAIGGGATSNTADGTNYIDYTYPSAIANGVAQDWSVLIQNANSTVTIDLDVYAICA